MPPWPKGKGNSCLPACPRRLTLVVGGSRNGQIQLKISWTDRSGPDPTKTKVKAERGVQENTRQYREPKEVNVIYLVFLTNILENFLDCWDSSVGLVH